MRVALVIASALALAVAVVIAVSGDDEDEAVVETTPVTVPETTPEPEPEETTPEEPAEPEPAVPDAPANGHGGEEAPVKCGRLAFEENTDSGASGIEAVEADCATARSVARGAENAGTDLSFEADGYRCSGAHGDTPLDTIEWICIGPDREVVSFVTS